jgi:hypothetical protein
MGRDEAIVDVVEEVEEVEEVVGMVRCWCSVVGAWWQWNSDGLSSKIGVVVLAHPGKAAQHSTECFGGVHQRASDSAQPRNTPKVDSRRTDKGISRDLWRSYSTTNACATRGARALTFWNDNRGSSRLKIHF